MKSRLIPGLVLVGSLFISGGAKAIPELSASESQAVVALWHDGRLVRDAVAFHLEEITPDQSWGVAQIKPDPKSSQAHLVGSYIDGRTGELIQTPGERTYTGITEWGTLAPVAVLSGDTPIPPTYRLEYEWKVRLQQYEEEYPLFTGALSRTAVFRINAGAKGKGLFKPAYLVADEWTPFMPSALKYVQENKAIFDAKTVDEHLSPLRELLSSPNLLVAVTAARVLSDAHQLPDSFVRKSMAQAKGLELSVFAFLFLRQSPDPDSRRLNLGDEPLTPEKLNQAVSQAMIGDVSVEDLGQFIDTAPDAETLKSVTIGLVALTSGPTSALARDTIFTATRVTKLLERVVARQKTLGTHSEADAYLDMYPALMGFHHATPTTSGAPR